MKKFAIAGIAALAIAGSTAVYAQHRPWSHEHMRMSPEDRAAFTDARIAAVKAGLKLTPDQEKLWPPVESAVREMVKIKLDRAAARAAAAAAAKPDDSVAALPAWVSARRPTACARCWPVRRPPGPRSPTSTSR